MDADGSRWLLADHLGSLSLLVLSHDGPRVLSLALEPLGTVSAPVTLTYLDSGVIYVGSCSGARCPLIYPECVVVDDGPSTTFQPRSMTCSAVRQPGPATM